jgi:5-methylcytosine-specific restriction endonuclease McrA
MRYCFLSTLPLLLCPVLLVAQSGSRQSGTPKVCVATVSNVSTVSAYLERLTEHLVKTLQRNKVDAITMASSTTSKRRLRPTRQNVDEAEDKQCSYTLLT